VLEQREKQENARPRPRAEYFLLDESGKRSLANPVFDHVGVDETDSESGPSRTEEIPDRCADGWRAGNPENRVREPSAERAGAAHERRDQTGEERAKRGGVC